MLHQRLQALIVLSSLEQLEYLYFNARGHPPKHPHQGLRTHGGTDAASQLRPGNSVSVAGYELSKKAFTNSRVPRTEPGRPIKLPSNAGTFRDRRSLDRKFANSLWQSTGLSSLFELNVNEWKHVTQKNQSASE